MTGSKSPIIFVLGPPGAGKGTQCLKIASHFQMKHISAGDLLRAEVSKGTERGKMIDDIIKNGSIVPSEITLELLQDTIAQNADARGFLIDGFPRKLDQALMFEETISAPAFVLFFDCPEQYLVDRLLKRGAVSGRSDDNAETIKKRFNTYHEVSMACVERYEGMGLLVRIDGGRDVEVVWDEVRAIFEKRKL